MAGTSYTRQSTMSDGDTITAALFNNEFNQILNAFAYASSSTTGHQHDGGAGEGGNIEIIGDQDFLNKIVVDGTNNRWGFFVEVSSSAVEQIRIQDGAIVPVTDNDIDLGTSSLEFKDAYFDGTVTTDALTVDANATVGGTLGVTGALTGSSTLQGTTITATTAFVPDASDGAALGTTSLEFSDLYLADGAVVYFGDDQDVSLTHVADTGLLLSSTDQLQFGDSGTYIYQSADGVLDLVSDTEIELTATTIDINGAVAMDGAMTGGTNITISGELDAATLDISGDADIDGTLEADAITVDGTALNEYIADTVGAMVGSNTETGIAVTYEDGDNTLDFVLGAAQTTITSLLATDIKIGEDDQTKIDFETADEIHFYAANVEQVYLGDNIFGPQSDSDVDLGSSSVRWKDAYVDSITVTGEVDGASLDISGNADIDGTLEADAITVDGTALNEYIADTVGAMVSSNTETNITVTYEDGDNTLDFVIGTLNQDTTGNAATFTATANNSTDETVYPVFVDGATGSQGAETDTGFTYNPSSGLLTISGELDAGSLDISGNADIDGTTNLDAVDIDGAVQIDNTVTVGVDDTGYDVKFFGATASAYMLWDESVDDLILAGAARVVVPDGQLVLGSTAVSSTAAELNILDGKAFLDEDDLSSDSATGIASQQSIKAYVDTNAGTMSSFQLEDDDGTEVAISNAKEVKFIGSGITTNWTDTDNGTDGDPYDLTFTVDAAQTGITSLLATDIKIGEDDQTKIDFETANEIHFYADNAEQVYIADGIFGPQTDNDVDLGASGVEWKDAYFDGTVTTDALVADTADINAGSIDGTTIGANSAAAGTFTTIADADGAVRAIPQSGSAKTSGYTLVTGDVGNFIEVGSSGAITIPNSTFSAGDAISIFNNTTGNITITCSITTAYKAGENSDIGSATLATRGVATILFISGTVCVISGNI